MRVISGKFKGMEIPFVNAKFNDANTTPQKIKKALFSILGEDLEGKSFLDLYACSGQIGIEALSRGAAFIVFNEIDRERFKFIKSILLPRFDPTHSSMIFNFHAFRCLRYLDSKDMSFDFIFLDPPYSKSNSETEIYYNILDEINKYRIIKSGGKIIIQHRANVKLNDYGSDLKYSGTKKYAKNSLFIFEKN